MHNALKPSPDTLRHIKGHIGGPVRKIFVALVVEEVHRGGQTLLKTGFISVEKEHHQSPTQRSQQGEEVESGDDPLVLERVERAHDVSGDDVEDDLLVEAGLPLPEN